MGRRSAANVLLFLTYPVARHGVSQVKIYRYSRFRITANFWNALHRVTCEAADSAGGAVLPQPFPCPRKARGRLQRCCRKPQRSVISFWVTRAFAGAEQQAENKKDVQEGLLYVCPGRLPAVSFFLLLVLDQALLL